MKVLSLSHAWNSSEPPILDRDAARYYTRNVLPIFLVGVVSAVRVRETVSLNGHMR